MNGQRRSGTFMQCNITQPQKGWNNAIWSNMDGPENFYTNWNKSEKDKHHMTSFICGTKKKNYTNELIYKTETDSERMNLWLTNEG